MNSWFKIVLPKDFSLEKFYNSKFFLGIEEQENIFVAYFEKSEASKKFLEKYNLQTINKEDWQETWQEYFQPVTIADFTIVPPWKKDLGNLIINPARGFGTGHHETTQLATEFLLEIINKNKNISMLDIGTGSGILSIIAQKKGVSKIRAIDIDKDAIENALENIKLNNLDSTIEIDSTPIEKLDKKFDLVVANIITPVLLSIKENFSKLTKKHLILTGIEKKEEKEFLNQIKLDDFILKDIKHNREWIAYLFEKEI